MATIVKAADFNIDDYLKKSAVYLVLNRGFM